MTGLLRWINDKPQQRIGVRVLQVAIGLMLLFRIATESRYAGYLWGPNGEGAARAKTLARYNISHIWEGAFATNTGTYVVLALLMAAALCLITDTRTRWATAVALGSFYVLEQRLPEILDGGDNIVRIALVYMLFLMPSDRQPTRGSIMVWAHNVAVAAIVTQLMILYETSALQKAFGQKWHDGTAMYFISQVDWFTLPGAHEMFKVPAITVLATYAAVLYQAPFAAAIFSRVKLPWLAVGLMFHLNIMIMMGLVPFSLAMIGLELFVITDHEYVWLLSRAAATLNRASAWGAEIATRLVGRRISPILVRHEWEDRERAPTNSQHVS